jgi:hypothetical protein
LNDANLEIFVIHSSSSPTFMALSACDSCPNFDTTVYAPLPKYVRYDKEAEHANDQNNNDRRPFAIR